jgi:hypothetical protein
MKELVKLWREFMKEWAFDPKNIADIDGEERMMKPTFFDFMDWVHRNYDTDKA